MDDLINQLNDDEQFNWDDILFDDPSIPTNPNDPHNISVDDLEIFLMNDDDDINIEGAPSQELSYEFISNVLLDSPIGSEGSTVEVVDDVSSGGSNKDLSPQVEEKDSADEVKENDSTDADDPLSKKRKRQLRNRDAAVRSRERKKMYVKELEMKSRYYEGECKRLGMLLQCYLAENQALRLSLQSSKTFDVSMTKQESAVLLLESLLLGSLLWFLGIMCLLILPSPFQPSLGGEEEHLEIKKSERRPNLTPQMVATKFFDRPILKTYLVGRTCKASRSRMKPNLFCYKSFCEVY